MSEFILIEIIYTSPRTQTVLRLKAPAGATVAQAIELSGILVRHPEIDFSKNRLGIHGKLTKPDTALRDRDRVEIYRPLLADPKQARRKRAKKTGR